MGIRKQKQPINIDVNKWVKHFYDKWYAPKTGKTFDELTDQEKEILESMGSVGAQHVCCILKVDYTLEKEKEVK